jgi:hypothetical protein
MERASLAWVPLSETHIETAVRIASEIHPELPERAEVFLEKMKLFPPGRRQLSNNVNIYGYGISHPWTLYDIPSLDTFLVTLHENPNGLYPHDVAVLPLARGHQAASRYVEIIRAAARLIGVGTIACVAFNDADAFWSRLGFAAHQDRQLISKLSSYGEEAKYMTADI